MELGKVLFILPFHYLPPPLPTFSLSLPHMHTGSQDGTVHIWSADTGEKVAVLDGGHPGPTHCTQFNPKLMMMASACSSMVRAHCHVIAMCQSCDSHVMVVLHVVLHC